VPEQPPKQNENSDVVINTVEKYLMS